MKAVYFVIILLIYQAANSQQVKGVVKDKVSLEPVAGATIYDTNGEAVGVADSKGRFSLVGLTGDSLRLSAAGFASLSFYADTSSLLQLWMEPLQQEMDAVVVTGTMRAVKKADSPVNVEVYTPQFFKKNPAPSIFESLQNVNGVRPQLNCSVCNTGDIHINGLEGPYTMVTIDGMPIVSSLASVYGLFGIPTQLIERVEIVKGPASGLYGSEAIGGLINIITRTPEKAPLLSANVMTTSWLEHNADIGLRWKLSKKISSLTGIHYFNYQHPFDKNKDGFTDVALQHRVSVFNKWSLQRRQNRAATLAGRYFYEDRWGGQNEWTKTFRGTDSIYGESIYTSRWELMGNYQLPVQEKIFFSLSATGHRQNSFYGTTLYKGSQDIVFGQLTWDKKAGPHHQLLTGAALRYSNYDDNSTATRDTLTGRNMPDRYVLPGIFIQDEWKINNDHLLLLGMRYDYHPAHKGIVTPRIAWKWSLSDRQTLRLNAGTGFRVVSLFTEDHAALTGARNVEIKEALKPERSYNANLNYMQKFRWNNFSLDADATAWYSYFTNQIIADYDTDPNKIIYQNLDGYAVSGGLSLNLEMSKGHRFKTMLGATLQDVNKTEKDENGKSVKQPIMLTEKWSGTWGITYIFPALGITVDYTGNLYGPMRLPLLSPLDPRPGQSPVWSIQNIQLTKLIRKGWEVYGGVKNLLNWTPARNVPFLIARSQDPFDKQVEYDAAGQVKATPQNPYALTFDPSYVYAPNQGLRVFAGLRISVN
ncbi:MAG TPA: TonB-dependent receptor [Chitinophagaceae bacterium]|mgnify:CR=1 FL=1|nr:TonB-dependent receptor [Chitinophagaceae bacterium]